MESILRYLGKKNIDLTNYNIKQYKTYCELFSGSFNTGIKLASTDYKGKIIYNDLDSEVYNFWKKVVENPDRIYNNYSELKNNLLELNNNLEKENTLKEWQKSTDLFKRASAEYIYRKCLTMRGLKFTRGLTETTELIDMYLTSEMFKEQKIEINNLDYKDMIKKINEPSTFILVDPPYIDCESVKNYRCDSINFNHIQLYNELKDFKGNWLLTYNNSPKIKELYKEYNIEEITRHTCGVKYTELYITNK